MHESQRLPCQYEAHNQSEKISQRHYSRFDAAWKPARNRVHVNVFAFTAGGDGTQKSHPQHQQAQHLVGTVNADIKEIAQQNL